MSSFWKAALQRSIILKHIHPHSELWRVYSQATLLRVRLRYSLYYGTMLKPVFLKENVRYPVWTCRDPISSDSRDPIFSDSKDPMINSSESRDPIFDSRDPNQVPETP